MTNLVAEVSGGLAGGSLVLVLCMAACPLIMGGLMWVARRRDSTSQQTPTGKAGRPGVVPAKRTMSAKQAELVRTRAEIDRLRAAENAARKAQKRSR
ncbi:putative iron-regulated membrane protein [Kribbella aluminosa]|uniref:Iron-regulated membrane protein n=1 Tax=Kribbella aluminosa TaxID=416017 RepID=A0ABS4UBH5_9ACTN|nr:hypothetical protein [Kribbella aluminosa]MBP2349004.1 putative iron-regulated membrane protein [Kribbella aluminosa]